MIESLHRHAPWPASSTPLVKRNFLIDLLIVLGIALVGVVTWKLQPRADHTLPLSACDLNVERCSVDLPQGGRMELSAAPRPLPTLRPIRLELQLSGVEPDKVEIDFAGVGMNMGFNRPVLSALGGGRYAGEATLPVCVTGTMLWQATAMLHTGSGTLSVPFRFQAGGH